MNKPTATNNQTQPLKTTSEMVKSTCSSTRHFSYHLDQDKRKIR